MISGAFKNHIAEKVDILDIARRTSTPGRAVPESTIQSNLDCILVRKSESTETAPVTTQMSLYRVYLLEGTAPSVSQRVKRSDNERLTIVTKPRKFRQIYFFDAQHTS